LHIVEDILGFGPTGPPNKPLEDPLTNKRWARSIKDGYANDPTLSLILENPNHHTKLFTIRDRIIWTKNTSGADAVCLPNDQELITKVLTQAHETIGHYGGQRTSEYIWRWYWWPRMVADSQAFC